MVVQTVRGPRPVTEQDLLAIDQPGWWDNYVAFSPSRPATDTGNPVRGEEQPRHQIHRAAGGRPHPCSARRGVRNNGPEYVGWLGSLEGPAEEARGKSGGGDFLPFMMKCEGSHVVLHDLNPPGHPWLPRRGGVAAVQPLLFGHNPPGKKSRTRRQGERRGGVRGSCASPGWEGGGRVKREKRGRDEPLPSPALLLGLGLTPPDENIQYQMGPPGTVCPRNRERRACAMWSPKPDHPLRRLFSGLTEQTFMTTLGVADPQLDRYLSELLSRFISMDAIFRLRDLTGRRLEEVCDMLLEAQAMRPRGPHPPRGPPPHRRLHAVLDRGLSRSAEESSAPPSAATASSTTASRASAPTTSPAPSTTSPTASRPASSADQREFRDGRLRPDPGPPRMERFRQSGGPGGIQPIL